MDKTLKELQDRIIAFRNERDWKQFHKPKDIAMSLCLEAAEVLEHFQWKDEEEINGYVKNEKEELGRELSDVLAYLLIMASDLNIDLPDAFEKKMQENATKYPVQRATGKKDKYTKYE